MGGGSSDKAFYVPFIFKDKSEDMLDCKINFKGDHPKNFIGIDYEIAKIFLVPLVGRNF